MANVCVRVASHEELERWDDLLETSPQRSAFHRLAWLKAAAARSGTEFIPLIGLKGDRVICLFPVFLGRRLGLTLLVSPPWRCMITSLGPAFLFERDQQSATESAYIHVVDAFIRFAQERGVDQAFLRTSKVLPDVRPFLWGGFEASPLYTYAIPLAAEEDALFASFQGEMRQKIRRAQKYEGLEVVTGGYELYRRVLSMTRKRYEEEKISWMLPDEPYMEEVYRGFGDWLVKPWAILHEGALAAGLIMLYHGGEVHRWLGGANAGTGLSGMNELLDWRVMQDGQARRCSHYDLVGASNKRLNRFKSKYNPRLQLYFSLKKSFTALGKVASFVKDTRWGAGLRSVLFSDERPQA